MQGSRSSGSSVPGGPQGPAPDEAASLHLILSIGRAFRIEINSTDGTGTLQEPVITIPFRTYSRAAGDYSVCPFEASTGDYSSDGTGTLQEPVITIPFRTYSCAAGNYSVCLFEASTGLSGVSQPLQCEMVE